MQPRNLSLDHWRYRIIHWAFATSPKTEPYPTRSIRAERIYSTTSKLIRFGETVVKVAIVSIGALFLVGFGALFVATVVSTPMIIMLSELLMTLMVFLCLAIISCVILLIGMIISRLFTVAEPFLKKPIYFVCDKIVGVIMVVIDFFHHVYDKHCPEIIIEETNAPQTR